MQREEAQLGMTLEKSKNTGGGDSIDEWYLSTSR